jgi:anti-anti-sigma factor
MEIHIQRRDKIIYVSLQGRFDAVGSKDATNTLIPALQPDDLFMILDMEQIDYLSSAGLRIILSIHKRFTQSGGAMVITQLQPYCKDVMELVGFATAFPILESTKKAKEFLSGLIEEQTLIDNWEDLETVKMDCGSFRIIPQPDVYSAVDILGDVNDVLESRITPAHLCSKNFFSTEYSIGLGGLGECLDDYFTIMGEMITIGGTMVWLPTDGSDMPDFLIPKNDTGQITIRTGFNISIAGGFNELMAFESESDEGVDIDSLYQALYQLANKRRSDYWGVLGLAIRAQMPAVYGSGVKRSPVMGNSPDNGEKIMHPSNIAEWIDYDETPRHKNVTGLICGLGVEQGADLSQYDKEELDRVFYMHPSLKKENQVLLHNHAVVFDSIPFPERPVNLDREIKNVVEKGEFVDMRHLLSRSTIKKALIGVAYIQEFRRDPKGYQGV